MIYIGDIYATNFKDTQNILDHIISIENNSVISFYYSIMGKQLLIYNEHKIDTYIDFYYKVE